MIQTQSLPRPRRALDSPLAPRSTRGQLLDGHCRKSLKCFEEYDAANPGAQPNRISHEIWNENLRVIAMAVRSNPKKFKA